jgi:hypothetical protein
MKGNRLPEDLHKFLSCSLGLCPHSQGFKLMKLVIQIPYPTHCLLGTTMLYLSMKQGSHLKERAMPNPQLLIVKIC